jgi:hypothetical protein
MTGVRGRRRDRGKTRSRSRASPTDSLQASSRSTTLPTASTGTQSPPALIRPQQPVFITMGALACTFGSSTTQRLPSVERVAGVYVRCPFHCERITLARDGHFTIVLDGDLFNNEKAIGTWVITSVGHILLNSDHQPTVLENVRETEGGIRFKILDHEGNALSFAYGFVYCPQSTGQWTLQEDHLYRLADAPLRRFQPTIPCGWIQTVLSTSRTATPPSSS